MKQFFLPLFLCLVIFDSLAFDVQMAYKNERSLYQLSSHCPQGEELKMGTINLGMLKLWPIAVPGYPDRSTTLLNQIWEYLSDSRPVSLSFQELWNEKEHHSLNALAKHLGYQVVFENYNSNNVAKRGLQLIIRNDWTIIEKGFIQYSDKAWFDKVGGYERGLMYALAKSPQGFVVLFTNTHLSPMIDQWQARKIQLQESAQLIHQFESKAHLLTYIGDLNFSPEFEIFPPVDLDLYEQNVELYNVFYQEKFLDTYKILNMDPGYSYDAKLNPTISGGIFAREPRQRLDYVWVKSSVPFSVQSSRLIFNTPVQLLRNRSGQDVFLSDHFGVESSLALCF